jgi:hypothetical protein
LQQSLHESAGTTCHRSTESANRVRPMAVPGWFDPSRIAVIDWRELLPTPFPLPLIPGPAGYGLRSTTTAGAARSKEVVGTRRVRGALFS